MGTVQLLIRFEENLSFLNTCINGLQAITADSIIYFARNKIGSNEIIDEILQDFQEYLEKRRSQLRLSRGFATSQKLIVVENARTEDIYKQLLNVLKFKMRTEKD